jgi:hypothetical protein
MRSWLVMFLTLAVLFLPVAAGTIHVAEAKTSYKSGTKSFDVNKSSTNPGSSSVNQPQSSTTNPSKNATMNPAPTQLPQKGGFMKGLFFGGMAGLLFGSLFSDFGGLGMILGLLVNIAAAVLVVVAIRGIITYFKNNRRKRENHQWRP